MYSVSKAYKQCMDAPLRNRFFVNVSIGVVNQSAQGDGSFSDNLTEWSNPEFPWNTRTVDTEYATWEQDYFKADGSLTYLPEGEYKQYNPNVGIATEEILGAITITFGTAYDIKGFTIDFGRAYPTEFSIETDSDSRTYTNDAAVFETTDRFGEITHIVIRPITMVGGNQRLRIQNIIMGVGLTFNNTTIQNMDFTESVDAVARELPSKTFNLSVTNENHMFNVDSTDSFIGYLETGQPVSASIGLQLDDNTIEQLPIGKFYLSDWKSTKYQMSFTATDIFTLLDDTYTEGNTIHTRTLYDDATAVLTYCGFEPDQYVIDECLRDVTVNNPIPEVSCAQALQLIANAGRCIVCQDRDGLIVFKANFATVIEPDDIQVTSDTDTAYSNPHNTLLGVDYVYADFTRNFFSADGSMYYLPENGEEYLDTGFVSSDIADESGNYTTIPSLTMQLQAGFVYYGLTITFDGNAPQEINIKTSFNGDDVDDYTITDVSKSTYIPNTFHRFDTMVISFPKGAPQDRVVVNTIRFGDLTDYRLTYNNIIGDVLGFRETKTKNVLVRVYTFQNDEEGRPQEVNDSVYVTHNVNSQGTNVIFGNPLIGTESHARDVAEWLGAYYFNNASYSCDYRGEPRLDAADIIFLDSDVLNNLQVEIEKHTLKFNGALSGNLDLRRALRMEGA